ncbi:MAG: hypothetical protein ABF586_13265, partial [Sporolactobacillus sp.]
MKIRLIATNQVKDVYSAIQKDGRYEVRFTPSGKTYTYRIGKIEIVGTEFPQQSEQDALQNNLIIYGYSSSCYKCKNPFDILTYVTFEDTFENLTYPWDKHRLNHSKSWDGTLAHMQDESIEYYPLSVIGNISILDRLMLERFSAKIKVNYSQTVKRVYPM